MSKKWILGLGLIGLGGVFAYFHDTFNGMLYASVCLILGLVIVASQVHRLVSQPPGGNSNSRGREQAQIMILVKGEVHTYPQRDGKLQKIQDPNQTDLEFDNWQLGDGGDNEEESDWPAVTIRKAPAGLPELDTAAPLECGAPREGWLHFRIRNTTPSELRDGSLEFSVEDFFSDTHTALAGKVLLPGNVCPIPASAPPEVDAKKDNEPPSSDRRLAAT